MKKTIQERIRELNILKRRIFREIDEVKFQEQKIQEAINGIVRSGDIVELRKHIREWNVHCESTNGYNALGWACFEGHLHIVKYLIEECGADPHRADRRGRTPIIDAVSTPCDGICNIDVVRYLIVDKNVDVNHQTNEGFSALTIACRDGRLDVVRLLVEEGKANVHLRDHRGRSFLSQAVLPFRIERLNLDVLVYLIRVAKLDPCARDKKNWTAIHIVSMEIINAATTRAKECSSIQETILRYTGPGSWVPPAWAGG